MKNISFLIVIMTILISSASIALPIDTFPSMELETLDGKAVNIKDYIGNGKITVVSFWATWCSPCKKELDAIAKVYPQWQKDYDVNLIAITIDNEKTISKVSKLVETKQWKYTVLSDAKRQLQSALNFQSIPQTFLLDESGDIIYSHSGYNQGDELELQEKMASLVK